ncbi:cation diffusion facilitator family transporter [uncultured Corynebacterium sp.]|uniref:cation diffusion facilitator family transporter n=1 Tax=uncultured Corynebacterium sp. TaxID=159447 RepID=UPI0025FAADAA|nr:cation diffusion facilitator family transporter [uncultured Corynebacterium sp.]
MGNEAPGCGSAHDGRGHDRARDHDREQAHDHGHDHSHGVFHAHDHDHSGTAVSRLALAFGLTALILIAEVVGGIVANSLALLADAAHMASDALGLLIALAAAWIGSRPATRTASYGFRRAEVLGALVNAVLVGAAGAWILFEAFRRWSEPADVASGPVLIIAVVGLVANVVAAVILAGGDKSNMNLRAALLHVMVDALGSVGVLVSALVVRWTGFARADIIAAVLIALLVIPQAVALIRNAATVLLELAPSKVDTETVETWMRGRPGVHGVHDLHVWSIHGTDVVLTAHVTVDDGIGFDDACSILCDMESGLAAEFDVGHATLQLETPTHHAHERPREV